jgi:repressor LexA
VKTLTRRQKEILDFLASWIDAKGYSPTYREIMSEFKFSSVGTVVGHMKALAEKGYIQSEPKKRRSIQTLHSNVKTSSGQSEIELPFAGMIQASFPIELYHDTKSIKVPSSLVRIPELTYILQVQGNSLLSEQMKDGDLLLVEARQEADNAELVIFIRGDETHIKRYFPEGDFARLEGSIEEPTPHIFRHDEITIQGVIIGLIRTYL